MGFNLSKVQNVVKSIQTLRKKCVQANLYSRPRILVKRTKILLLQQNFFAGPTNKFNCINKIPRKYFCSVEETVSSVYMIIKVVTYSRESENSWDEHSSWEIREKHGTEILLGRLKSPRPDDQMASLI